MNYKSKGLTHTYGREQEGHTPCDLKLNGEGCVLDLNQDGEPGNGDKHGGGEMWVLSDAGMDSSLVWKRLKHKDSNVLK